MPQPIQTFRLSRLRFSLSHCQIWARYWSSSRLPSSLCGALSTPLPNAWLRVSAPISSNFVRKSGGMGTAALERRQSIGVTPVRVANRAVVDVIGAGDLPDWFARLAPLDCLCLLVRGELRLAAHFHPACLGPLSAFTRPRPDQVTLEFCKAA
jgi:hypothetical protein